MPWSRQYSAGLGAGRRVPLSVTVPCAVSSAPFSNVDESGAFSSPRNVISICSVFVRKICFAVLWAVLIIEYLERLGRLAGLNSYQKSIAYG